MNKMVSIKAAPDYDQDGYGWAMAQAEAIRARDFDAIDWDNVAEEIESVGKSEASSLQSALRVLMMHILKWTYQPERRSRSWALSIVSHRQQFEDVLEDNPSLKSRLDELRDRAYRRSRVEAALETGLALADFPIAPPDWHTILNAPFDVE
jgi:hypothetical protein